MHKMHKMHKTVEFMHRCQGFWNKMGSAGYQSKLYIQLNSELRTPNSELRTPYVQKMKLFAGISSFKESEYTLSYIVS